MPPPIPTLSKTSRLRFDSTMQAADWLSKQLADLQIKVETSQSKLIEYQKEHGIVGTDDKQNLTFEKLNDLGKRLTEAQADRIQKESLYRIAKGNQSRMIWPVCCRNPLWPP